MTGHRLTDPDTSVAADAAAHACDLAYRYAEVLAALCFAEDGLTDFELATRLVKQQTSIGKRRGELRDLGFVADTGTRRPAPSGALAIVWAITPAGREALTPPPIPGQLDIFGGVA
jgi:hypothetical protein